MKDRCRRKNLAGTFERFQPTLEHSCTDRKQHRGVGTADAFHEQNHGAIMGGNTGAAGDRGKGATLRTCRLTRPSRPKVTSTRRAYGMDFSHRPGAAIFKVMDVSRHRSVALPPAEIKALTAEGMSAAVRDTANASANDMLLEKFAGYRVAVETKIAIVKTLAEVHTAALTAAETRLAKAMEYMGQRLEAFSERVDRILERRE